MSKGILFYDKSNSSLFRKINDASEKYQIRYGEVPNLCVVNSFDFSPTTEVEGITIKSQDNLPSNYIWVTYSNDPNETFIDFGFPHLNAQELELVGIVKGLWNDFKPYSRTVLLLISAFGLVCCCLIAFFTLILQNLPG